MEPLEDATPSARVHIPENLEHAEAKQAAIDAERIAFIAGRDPETRAKYEVIERAQQSLRDAHVPFSLRVSVEPDVNGVVRFWHHHNLAQGNPFENREDRIRMMMYDWALLCEEMKWHLALHGFIIPVYHPDGRLLHVFKRPDN